MRTKISKNRISKKAASFTESVIREMTREAMKYGAVNLGQGFPDFAAPEDIKQKAMQAISDDFNQYAITWGVKSFRDAIAAKATPGAVVARMTPEGVTAIVPVVVEPRLPLVASESCARPETGAG